MTDLQSADLWFAPLVGGPAVRLPHSLDMNRRIRIDLLSTLDSLSLSVFDSTCAFSAPLLCRVPAVRSLFDIPLIVLQAAHRLSEGCIFRVATTLVEHSTPYLALRLLCAIAFTLQIASTWGRCSLDNYPAKIGFKSICASPLLDFSHVEADAFCQNTARKQLQFLRVSKIAFRL